MPDSCLDCGSENLGDKQILLYEENNTVLCGQCGLIMVFEEDEEETQSADEITASFLSCPHCHTVNEIQITEGEEWCSACGLDPNKIHYPPEEIAHLWRQGAGIRDAMERGVPKNTTRLYGFLTKFCGPHCSFATSCPQATANFAKCYREEFLGSTDSEPPYNREEEVSKGKGSRRARREAKKEQKRLKERAVLMCATSGWYEKNYYETQDPQRHPHTRGGSGT